MKRFVSFVILLVLSIEVFVDSNEDRVQLRSSNDLFMDPCKAAGYSGDAALTTSEFKIAKNAIMMQTANVSLYEMQDEDEGLFKRDNIDQVNEELQRIRNYLGKELKDRFAALREVCLQRDKVQCQHNRTRLRDEIWKIRIKWMRLKGQQIRTKHDNSEVKRMLRSIVYENKSSSESIKYTANIKFTHNEVNPICNTSIHMCSIVTRSTSDEEHSRHKRGAIKQQEKLWDNGVIPFMFDDSFSEKDRTTIRYATQEWEKGTCIIFKEKEPDDQNYILFTVLDCGCCSYIGKAGGGQAISIGEGCVTIGIVAHELGHVIGFHHEHKRPDRDNYVNVITGNIKPNERYNFNITEDINSLNETYDFDSIMHYSSDQFSSKPNLNTLVPLRRHGFILLPVIGQTKRPSEGDLRQARKLYGCPSCGRTLLRSVDTFRHTPEAGIADFCQWRISSAHGQKIVLSITNLNFAEKAYNCKTDYLEVRDGHYIKSPLIKRFCGNHISEVLTSTGNRMWIEFRTRNGEGQGFNAKYKTACGGNIIQEEGFLTSPDYPDDYPSRKECVWTITVSENHVIVLQFNFFNLENHKNCRYADYLEVRDGRTEDSQLIQTFCGSRLPQTIHSSGRHLYLKFVSDASIQKSGFSTRFIQDIDECNTGEHGCGHVCSNTPGSFHCSCRRDYQLHSDGMRCEPACGGYIEDKQGTITSPSFPDLYPANRKCTWKITAPIDHTIHLTFTHFDLEQHGLDCNYDLLIIMSSSVSNYLHGKYCGYILPAPVISRDNILRIEFQSDATVQHTGFSANFITDMDECIVNNGGCEYSCTNTVGSYQCECESGFVLHIDKHTCQKERCQFDIALDYGYIYSPNYPGYYPNREDCSWHVSTAPGHRVRFNFKSLDMEPNKDCFYDHVAVYDGDNIRDDRLIGKYCGSIAPGLVTSSGNNMLMTFFSDASVQRGGFEIVHDVLCGANLTASDAEQHFVSHTQYGIFDYEGQQNCQWIIKADKGRFIQLKFTYFELESRKDCDYDVVIVYDGLYDTDTVTGRFCGLEIPDEILSSSEFLRVVFQSDDTINRKGFSATYQLVPSATV